jgi:hypothetical protein
MLDPNISRVIWVSIFCLHLAVANVESQGLRDRFIIEPNRPAVYLHVEKIKMGAPEEDGKRHKRVWLELHNNCNLPIWVHTTGAPSGDSEDAVGVMDIIVEQTKAMIQQDGKKDPDIEAMPAGTFGDVGSMSSILPGKSLRFSLPASHFGTHWEIHIPYHFDLPEGHAPRDDTAWGGETIMYLAYSFYDLPQRVQQEWNQAR